MSSKMQFHLPLSPTDQVLQPPASYLIVQDWALLYCMFGWTVAYVLYVRQAFIDKSYGMPIANVCLNIAFEFIFGVIIPTSVAQVVCFVPWLVIDVGIVYSVVKFGPNVWKDSPLVARNLGVIMATGILSCIVMFWTIIETMGKDDAAFYLAYTDELIISTLSIAHLLKRGNTSGHSFGIWLWRASATIVAVFAFEWRYWHYPAAHARVGQPFSTFLFVTFTLLDLVYLVIYLNLARKEKSKLI